MTAAKSIVFLIPCYQPTDLLPGLLEELRRANSAPIVVVDDGSGADFAPAFARIRQMEGIAVLTNAVNLGKGAALKHGMNHILVHHPDCVGVVTADADGQHAVSDIMRVTESLQADPDRVAFGVRAFDTEVPLRSRFGNTVSRHIYRFLIGIDLSDTQTGLRGIPRRLMELCLAIRANRYEFETEQLVVIKASRMPVREVPIQTIYIESNRDSHFRPLRDSARIYFVLLRYSIASIVTEMADLAVFATVMAAFGDLVWSNVIGRLVALWVQFMLLQSFVFHLRANAGTLAMYLGLVVVSGVISTALQLQIANIVPFPVVAKVMAEVLVFVFNFLFLRDFVFGRSDETTRD
ncbi:MAG: glycosyltransferase [Bradyrhizobium sp.]|nr:bifunctional glycosyltransferase family 2/GtrA family protein [Bradyrhizobium sp.]